MAVEDKNFSLFLEEWVSALPEMAGSVIFQDPNTTAIICVDVINGFCKFGVLASPRVATIIPPIVRLFQQAWQAGCRNLILTQDTHEPDAVEFGAFPPHCVRGTEEAETVSEIKALPFFDQLTIMEKNSINSGLNTGLDAWIAAHPEVHTYLVVGDCTDLCTYQLAMHLRLSANALQKQRRVLVPENCADTYDTPIQTARQIGAFAHPADYFHNTFLYHMALNGVEVVKEIK
ncbi:MAG: isochorismatase family protein [Anaerolineaceae bacterium]|jgi:nicotinamidase-related amidase|nr:MAG: isochorismatase family protein [Anaerolineaceae bacterium]